jgi:hypothetical protein
MAILHWTLSDYPHKGGPTAERFSRKPLNNAKGSSAVMVELPISFVRT